MYEVIELDYYRQQWLEAERDLAINCVELPGASLAYEPTDIIDKDAVTIQEAIITPTRIDDCKPGATKSQVFEALYIIATAKVKSKPDLMRRT